MRAIWRYGVICAALVCGGLARGEDLAAIFSRLASGIGSIPYEDVLKGSAVEALAITMGEAFPPFEAALGVGADFDELVPLIDHPEAGVRMLAMLNLFALEDQAAFPAIHARVNDTAVWPEPADAGDSPAAGESPHPSSVAWLARRMLAKIGYRSDGFEEPGEKLRFEEWAAARIGNPEWIAWYHFLYGRAIEGSRSPEEAREKTATLRSEIDNLPERAHDWVMLSFFPIYSFLTYPIASEEEWAEAGRRIGSHDLLAFLTDGARAGMRDPAIDPQGQTRHFLVIRGRSIFTEQDADALYELGMYITAAEAKPGMASEWLREAQLKWKNRATDFEYGEVMAALMELRPESELEYVLDWFYGPENEFIVAYQYDFISSYYRRRPQEWDATMKAIISHPSFENLTVHSVNALFDYVGMGAER